MRPTLTIKGLSTTQERYTYGQRLLYGGVYSYGGPGSLSGIEDGPTIYVEKLSGLGTLVTYSDPTYSYSDDRLIYSGYPSGQAVRPTVFIAESPRLSLDYEN